MVYLQPGVYFTNVDDLNKNWIKILYKWLTPYTGICNWWSCANYNGILAKLHLKLNGMDGYYFPQYNTLPLACPKLSYSPSVEDASGMQNT